MHFFQIFHEKTTVLIPIFCQQNDHYLKKTRILLKAQCSHVYFQIFMKNPILLCPYLVKQKRKVFFLLFAMENPCSDAHILSKIRPFSQKILFPCSFFQIFHQKTPAVMSIFGQKNAISVKTTIFYGPKKSIKCLFFFKEIPENTL